MGQPLSVDLRIRLLAAADGGLSCRAAASGLALRLNGDPLAGTTARYRQRHPDEAFGWRHAIPVGR